MTKTWTKDEIKNVLATSAVFVERALIVLYNRQTEVEKSAEHTDLNNGVGFNGPDAKFGTVLAKWIQKSNKVEGQRLSISQLAAARKLLPKYAKQLADHANTKACEKRAA